MDDSKIKGLNPKLDLRVWSNPHLQHPYDNDYRKKYNCKPIKGLSGNRKADTGFSPKTVNLF